MGFEPTVPFSITGFQDQLLKPLGHLSVHFGRCDPTHDIVTHKESNVKCFFAIFEKNLTYNKLVSDNDENLNLIKTNECFLQQF